MKSRSGLRSWSRALFTASLAAVVSVAAAQTPTASAGAPTQPARGAKAAGRPQPEAKGVLPPVEAPPMIFVVVNGTIRSSHVDAADGKTPVETVTIHELIPHVYATYRTVAMRTPPWPASSEP